MSRRSGPARLSVGKAQYKTMLKLLLGLVCVSCVLSHSHDCITPDSKAGKCVPLSSCPSLSSKFSSISNSNYIFLRRSQCGYSGPESEVCCPTPGANPGKSKTFQIDFVPPERVPKIPLANRFGGSSELPAPGECGIQSFDNKIFGGEITGIDEFPWMALLEYGNSKLKTTKGHGFACGGALIHARWVLTAAHCVTGNIVRELGGLVGVRLGEYNIDTWEDCDPIAPTDCSPPPINVTIEKIISHPDYKSDLVHQYHDIALLKLSEDVQFSDFVTPICIAKNIEGSLFNSGNFHFVAGWGQTEKGQNSPIKLKLKLPMVPNQSCSSAYSNRFKIALRSSQLCAGGSGKEDSCRGDSGGPLMVPAKIPGVGPAWFLTGVVSFGPNPCATRGVPGVYTKVQDYYDWIKSNM